MPVIDVTLVAGRSPAQLRALVTALTDAAVEAIEAPRDSVRVILREVPPTHWAAGDVTVAERRSRSDSSPDPASGEGTTP
jgi:4-oxalocrotonate tautomerase